MPVRADEVVPEDDNGINEGRAAGGIETVACLSSVGDEVTTEDDEGVEVSVDCTAEVLEQASASATAAARAGAGAGTSATEAATGVATTSSLGLGVSALATFTDGAPSGSGVKLGVDADAGTRLDAVEMNGFEVADDTGGAAGSGARLGSADAARAIEDGDESDDDDEDEDADEG